jgi:hypothetical protein
MCEQVTQIATREVGQLYVEGGLARIPKSLPFFTTFISFTRSRFRKDEDAFGLQQVLPI